MCLVEIYVPGWLMFLGCGSNHSMIQKVNQNMNPEFSGSVTGYINNNKSFLDNAGCGLEIFFTQNVLVVHTIFYNGRKTQVNKLFLPTKQVKPFTDFLFEEKTWYFLSISHSRARLGQSEVKVFVDGVLRGKSALKYPPATSVSRSRAPKLKCRW